jgi:hypothetical protein
MFKPAAREESDFLCGRKRDSHKRLLAVTQFLQSFKMRCHQPVICRSDFKPGPLDAEGGGFGALVLAVNFTSKTYFSK